MSNYCSVHHSQLTDTQYACNLPGTATRYTYVPVGLNVVVVAVVVAAVVVVVVVGIVVFFNVCRWYME